MRVAYLGDTGVTDTANDPVQRVYTYATQVHNLLTSIGIPEPAASYATYQTYHETQAYNNAGVHSYNNFSGIKYAGQKNATKGPNGYAIFKTPTDWANAFKHEITKGSNPAGAATLEDYAHRLKQNKYYEDSEANYIAGVSGLKRARLVLKVLPAADRASVQPGGLSVQDDQDMDIPGTVNYDTWQQKWKRLPTLAKGAIIGAGVLTVLGLFRD